MKNKKIQEKILVRFKAWWRPNGEDRAIFDNELEAKEWIAKLGDPSDVLEVKRIPGVIVNRPQRCGLLTARNEKVWVSLEGAER